MERVETLCDKLKEQVEAHVPVEQLLITVQMLQSELMHLLENEPTVKNGTPSIHIAGHQQSVKTQEPEKIVEVLQVDEAEVEAELEEIKKNIETREQIHAQSRPPLIFDPIEDTPTLTHQQQVTARKKELHEALPVENGASLNERLSQQKTELSDSLKDSAIKDLRKGIGVNDRFLFINELFKGDEVMYERSIKTINGFTIFPEAEYWIKRELKLKLAWKESDPVVKQFDQLIKRRFAAM